MNIYKLVQGTQEWHNFRLNRRGASEAAVMLGISPKATRTDLLTMKHTGIAKEFSDWVQENILDHGHEVEEMARPIIEKQIDDDLYPVTCGEDDGLLSASCDGLTMSRELAWEHKQWNTNLARSVAAGVLPDEHQPQCQQIMMVTPAKKVIFTVSDGTEENMVSMEVLPDADWQNRIRAGWVQFEEDLANFVPVEKTVKAVAAPQFGLPAVSIQVNGSIALIDNLQVFGTALTAYIERINREPKTDQDFADLESTVKTLKNAEDALDAAESGALAQTESIDVMRRTVAMYRETARTNRLLIDKLVKSEKESRKLAIVSEAAAEFVAHMNGLNKRIGRSYMPPVHSDFPGVVKGLKSIDSMRDKATTELARCKIEANAIADRIQLNLETPGLHGYSFLFPDIQHLVLKSSEDMAAIVQNRITAHESAETARIAEETARIAEQERIKAEAAAQERANAQIAEATRTAQAEAKRASAEAIAKAQAAQFEELEKSETKRLADLNSSMIVESNPLLSEKVVSDRNAAAFIDQIEASQTPPTLKLGTICTRLGFQVTADFLKTLGFEPAGRERAAVLYHEADFPVICNALIHHIRVICQAIPA